MATTSLPSPVRRAWLPAAFSLLMVGWGANQFASLLALYKQDHGFSALEVTSMLGIYVAGLIPALLLGGPYSDVRGRKPVTMLALSVAIFACVVMCFGAVAAWPLFVGRLLAGAATGLAMAATTSWVKELSHAPYDAVALPGAGARRSSLAAAAGFWLGPVVSGLMAAFLPFPEVFPYVFSILLTLPLLFMASRLPETRAKAAGPYPRFTWPSSARDLRFSRVVIPGAPWVFASNTLGFAVIPLLLTDLGDCRLLYTTIASAITLGTGVLIQQFARRWDDPHSARGVLVAIYCSLTGLSVMALTLVTQNPWIGLLGCIFLGAGYGLMLVGGLLETQRIAPPHQLGALTGVFYTYTYIGYLTPTIFSFVALWVAPGILTGILVALCLTSITIITINSRQHLHDGANP
jgi:MFS family permease